MTRIFMAIVASALLGACGGDDTSGGAAGGGSQDGATSGGTGGASPDVLAAVEDFCDAGCACADQDGDACSDQDRADCVEAYLGYELPGEEQCEERTVAAFACATERQAACGEAPVASLESCESTAGGC